MMLGEWTRQSWDPHTCSCHPPRGMLRGLGWELHKPVLWVPLFLALLKSLPGLYASPPLQAFCVPHKFLSPFLLSHHSSQTTTTPGTPQRMAPSPSLLFIYSEGFTLLPCHPN